MLESWWLVIDGQQLGRSELSRYACRYSASLLMCPFFPRPAHFPPQAATTATLADVHSRLQSTLVSLWARFACDSEEVAAEWLAWLRRADQSLLDALTACVRRSLHEVARALQGDHKGAELSPVFVLGVILDTNGRWAGSEGWGALRWEVKGPGEQLPGVLSWMHVSPAMRSGKPLLALADLSSHFVLLQGGAEAHAAAAV